MTCILGIETERGICSAALCLNGDLHEHTRKMERAHNEHILALVNAAVDAAGLGFRDVDAVAFGCGPGSFTGIRLAASVAQGVAFGVGAKVVPVSSSLALAVAAVEQVRLQAGVVVGIRSRRDAYYLASFAIVDGEPRGHRPDQLFDACPDWAEFAKGWPLVGDAPPWLPVGAEVCAEVAMGAGVIAKLGAKAFAKGHGLAPEFGLPAYVDGDTPWRASKPSNQAAS